jgi:hypothetical protein
MVSISTVVAFKFQNTIHHIAFRKRSAIFFLVRVQDVTLLDTNNLNSKQNGMIR